MKTTKAIQLIAAAMLLAIPAKAEGPVTTSDPVAHLRATYDFEGVTKIYKLEADINNDGRKEVFLAPQEPDEQGAELGWYLYIAKPNGQYVLAGESTDSGIVPHSLPSFRKDRYWVGYIPEIARYGLLTLKSGTGGQAKCQLHAIVIEGDGFKDLPIGQPVNVETDYDKLSQRFPTPLTPPIQELTP
jgi:hypothetical protein